METNKVGELIDVVFTNNSPILDSVICKSCIISYVKTRKVNEFKSYENVYIIAPVLIRDIEGRTFESTKEFLENFKKLIPDQGGLTKRKG